MLVVKKSETILDPNDAKSILQNVTSNTENLLTLLNFHNTLPEALRTRRNFFQLLPLFERMQEVEAVWKILPENLHTQDYLDGLLLADPAEEDSEDDILHSMQNLPEVFKQDPVSLSAFCENFFFKREKADLFCEILNNLPASLQTLDIFQGLIDCKKYLKLFFAMSSAFLNFPATDIQTFFKSFFILLNSSATCQRLTRENRNLSSVSANDAKRYIAKTMCKILQHFDNYEGNLLNPVIFRNLFLNLKFARQLHRALSAVEEAFSEPRDNEHLKRMANSFDFIVAHANYAQAIAGVLTATPEWKVNQIEIIKKLIENQVTVAELEALAQLIEQEPSIAAALLFLPENMLQSPLITMLRQHAPVLISEIRKLDIENRSDPPILASLVVSLDADRANIGKFFKAIPIAFHEPLLSALSQLNQAFSHFVLGFYHCAIAPVFNHRAAIASLLKITDTQSLWHERSVELRGHIYLHQPHLGTFADMLPVFEYMSRQEAKQSQDNAHDQSLFRMQHAYLRQIYEQSIVGRNPQAMPVFVQGMMPEFETGARLNQHAVLSASIKRKHMRSGRESPLAEQTIFKRSKGEERGVLAMEVKDEGDLAVAPSTQRRA